LFKERKMVLPQEIRRTIVGHNLIHPRITRYVPEIGIETLPMRQQVLTEMKGFHQSRNHPIFRDAEVMKLYKMPFHVLYELCTQNYIEMMRTFLTDPQVKDLSYIFHQAGFIAHNNTIYAIIFGKNGKHRAFLSVYKMGGAYQGSLFFKI